MKLRILNLHVPAKHDRIIDLPQILDPVSLTDYDAFIYEPNALNIAGLPSLVAERRRLEILELVSKKGGVVIALLRPDTQYDWLLDAFGSPVAPTLKGVRAGSGSQIRVTPSPAAVSAAYFEVLQGSLMFTAHLSATEAVIKSIRGTVLAVDSVGHAIALELTFGAGRICLLPIPTNATAERVGAAVVATVKRHFIGCGQVEIPSWSADVEVPGANVHNDAIRNLEKQQQEIAAHISVLTQDRERLLRYKQLLYGQGKAVLEPIVRESFRTFGFEVSEPEEYGGEWDVELSCPKSGTTALAEVEGSEGQINVQKYRQLLDYIEGEALEDREHKGFLVGNGFRQIPPSSDERRDQFSDHVKRGATRNRFCLIPTTELFKAVCAVLECPEDETFKTGVRESLIATTGLWKFAREQPKAAENSSVNKSQSETANDSPTSDAK